MTVAAPEIPITQWAKDHWSTLAYIETRIVDFAGAVDPRNLRCDHRIHSPRARGPNAAGYPTRLRDGATASPHDDWSCIEDFVREGLVIWNGTGLNPIFELTELGWTVAAALRKHKGQGGQFGDFVWPGSDDGRVEVEGDS